MKKWVKRVLRVDWFFDNSHFWFKLVFLISVSWFTVLFANFFLILLLLFQFEAIVWRCSAEEVLLKFLKINEKTHLHNRNKWNETLSKKETLAQIFYKRNCFMKEPVDDYFCILLLNLCYFTQKNIFWDFLKCHKYLMNQQHGWTPE